MSNICFSEMMIDDKDLEINSKIRYPRNITNKSSLSSIPTSNISTQNQTIEINKRSNLISIDESLRNLFPYLNDQVSY